MYTDAPACPALPPRAARRRRIPRGSAGRSAGVRRSRRQDFDANARSLSPPYHRLRNRPGEVSNFARNARAKAEVLPNPVAVEISMIGRSVSLSSA